MRLWQYRSLELVAAAEERVLATETWAAERIAAEQGRAERAEAVVGISAARVEALETELAAIRQSQAETLAAQLRAMELVRETEAAEEP